MAMEIYYVNRQAQPNGDHEVHTSGCGYLPAEENRQYLGLFSTCAEAVREAQGHVRQVNGCYWCSRPCHTG